MKYNFFNSDVYYAKSVMQYKNTNLDESYFDLYYDCFIIWLRDWSTIFLGSLGLLGLVCSLKQTAKPQENGKRPETNSTYFLPFSLAFLLV